MLNSNVLKKLTGFASVVGTAAVLTAASATAQELKFASFTGTNSTVLPGVVDVLAKAVDEGTGGATTIKYYAGGQLGAGPLEQYVRVVQGVADLSWGLPGYTSSQFTKTMLSELPGAIVKPGTGYDLIWNAYEAGLLDNEFPGAKPLALWMSEPNVLIMKDHIIRTPDDLKGLKIRVSGAVAGDVLTALGATPVQMPAPEIYNSLETGLIDGVVTGASAIEDFKIFEVANSYTTNVPLGSISFFTIINQGVYDGLSADAKAALDKVSGRVVSKNAEETWNTKANRVLDELRADADSTVVDLTDEQRKPFEDLVAPVVDKVLAETNGADVYKTMRGGM